MNDQNDISAEAKGRTRTASYIAVNGFRPYEGMGRALASAYSVIDQNQLPDDMLTLLDQIDRATGSPPR